MTKKNQNPLPTYPKPPPCPPPPKKPIIIKII